MYIEVPVIELEKFFFNTIVSTSCPFHARYTSLIYTLRSSKDWVFPARLELRSAPMGSQRMPAKQQHSQQARSLRNQGCSPVALVLF